MQLHLPEPGYSESDRAQGNFRLALKVSLYFVLLLWIVTLLDWGLGLELTRFGVRPRSFSGSAWCIGRTTPTWRLSPSDLKLTATAGPGNRDALPVPAIIS